MINMKNTRKKRKGFTLIELIATMSVVGVLVLLAVPRFMGHTQRAQQAKHVANVSTLSDASERYFVDEEDWPRLTDDPYTSSELEAYSEAIYDLTGEEVSLDPEGNYYDINYEELSKYVSVAKEDKNNYILQNPVGKVYYLKGLSDKGQARVDYGQLSSVENDAESSGHIVSIHEYENDHEPIQFHGLSAEAFDGNTSTFYDGGGVVTWDGNIEHREIEITGRGNGTSWPLRVRFLDGNGRAISPANSSVTNVIVSSRNTSYTDTVKTVVPEGAVRMEFYGTGSARVHNVRLPANSERPDNVTVTSQSTPSDITLKWDNTSRAIIRKNGEFLAEVNGQKYTDTPLYAGSEHNYDVILIDALGNGQKITYHAETDVHIVAFRGLSPAAFDGDDATYFDGSGYVTWDGDLANRELTITGRGNGTEYPLRVRFLDGSGNVLSPADSSANNLIISSRSRSEIDSAKTVVPEGAVRMEFYGTGSARVHNIVLPATGERPEEATVSSNPTPSNIKLNWTSVNRALVYKDGQLLSDVKGQSYTDTPLYPDSVHTYQVILLDDYGNGHKVEHQERTTTHVVAFNGLGAAAFDGDTSTFYDGGGVATWSGGDLSNREIEVTGRGNGTSYPLRLRFLDNNGQAITIEESQLSNVIISSLSTSQTDTTRVVVPNGAHSMEFYGTDSARVHNIQVID